MNANERRKAILELLCSRRFEKVDNLAFEFSVGRSTIKRDVLELSLSYPIFTQTGRYDGGIYLAPDYYLDKQYLKPSQQKLLESLTSTLEGDDLRILQEILEQFGRQTRGDSNDGKRYKEGSKVY